MGRLWLLVLPLVLLATGDAQSQRTQPRSNPPSAPATQPAAPDLRGTDQAPLTVKVLPAPDAKEKAEQEERERHEKARIDEKLAFETQRIADYTFWLAIFTAFLFTVAVGQAALFVWQLIYMRQGIDDARIAAEAAKASADTAKEQVALTKMGIVDLERAYLAAGPTSIEIRVTVSDAVKARGHTIPADPNEVVVRIAVTNTGRTAATIKVVYGEFSQKPPSGNVPIYKNGEGIETDLAILAGAAETLSPFEFLDSFTDPQFFWGYVEYWDIFKNKRTSRFCMMIIPERSSKGKMQLAGTDGWRECD